MAEFIVTDPKTGQKLRLTGDSPPTEAELEQIFAAQAPITPEQPERRIPAFTQLVAGAPAVLQGVIEEIGAGVAGAVGLAAGAPGGVEAAFEKGAQFREAAREAIPTAEAPAFAAPLGEELSRPFAALERFADVAGDIGGVGLLPSEGEPQLGDPIRIGDPAFDELRKISPLASTFVKTA